MNLIKQLDRDGCTTACIAMIGGTSYEHIRGNIFKDESHGIKRFLDNEFNIKSRFIKFTRLEDIKNDCILVVARLDLNLGPRCSVHAIVYDAKKKKILDPDTSNIKDLSNYNVVQCLEIIKEKKKCGLGLILMTATQNFMKLIQKRAVLDVQL